MTSTSSEGCRQAIALQAFGENTPILVNLFQKDLMDEAFKATGRALSALRLERELPPSTRLTPRPAGLAARRGRRRSPALAPLAPQTATLDRPEARPHCCPHFHQAVELVGKRWTGAILYVLIQAPGPLRFSEIALTSLGSTLAAPPRRLWSQ